jgi:hypothetical protein
MSEQQLDALPPVNPNQPAADQEQTKGGETPVQNAGEQPSSPVSGVPTQAPMVDPAASAPTDDPVATAAAHAAIPAIADDVDLIEKEWVEKAKQIVEQTKDDPYRQNEAMSKMKLDYLKKRYNREVKSQDEA